MTHKFISGLAFGLAIGFGLWIISDNRHLKSSLIWVAVMLAIGITYYVN